MEDGESSTLSWVHGDSQLVNSYVPEAGSSTKNYPQLVRIDVVEKSHSQYHNTRQYPQCLKESKWLRGPDMLWEDAISRKETEEKTIEVLPNDPEEKKSQVHSLHSGTQSLELTGLNCFSTWFKAKRAIANCLLFISRLKQRCENKRHLRTGEKDEEETPKIIELVTKRQDIPERMKKRHIKKASRLYGLDPFLDNDGPLRVGGRLQRSDEAYERKHLVILPQGHHVTKLVILHCHEQTKHQGRGMTLNRIRESGYWILRSSIQVARLIRKCVICNRLRSPVEMQQMSDLPCDRLTPAPPFTYSGVDCFGPWMIKEGRKELKRWGVLFTCTASRAVHIETVNSLSTDAFIQAFRRFTALRGQVRQLRGTNFVGAASEFKKAWSEMDHEKVKDTLLKEGCDYVKFVINVPSASHMGGVWKRQIRSIRSVLDALMFQSGRQLDDESLRTLMCEAAAVVNSRPLTVNHLDDPTYPAPLTPNHILTMRSTVLSSPPGNFQSADLYSRKRWRRVQHLVNEFWKRWKKEFLQGLQVRQKWMRPQRDAMVHDVVIIKDDNAPRNQWAIARVIEVFPSVDSRVREVRLAVGDPRIDNKGKRAGPISELERPIHKLVLLLPKENQEEFPVEEPSV
ncbi:PREDICTED: uncharacterized protein LOC106813181 [Priapulus caudatus]|uniref:Uncharacterized protein LOC106813181 n=1 Tax=Priapulus caudatus TaxID=37621 RepID=A0ABM1EKL4_PRICU|nr:PREDICTED: uncharacterized protein LOC106813181 [Priapulus caudatus]